MKKRRAIIAAAACVCALIGANVAFNLHQASSIDDFVLQRGESGGNITSSDISPSDIAPLTSDSNIANDTSQSDLPPAPDLGNIPAFVAGQVQTLNGTSADANFEKIAKDYGSVSAQVAIIVNGKVAYTMEYGYANREDKVAATADTKYRIASLSKVFTTMNALKLYEQGKFSLDDDIKTVSKRKTRNPKYSSTPITMRMLLTHTSSIVDDDPTYAKFPWAQLASANTYGSYRPGTRHTYSNFAFGYVGACLEKSSGKVISELANDNFFDELDIDASYDGSRIKDKSQIATLYRLGKVSRTVKEICAKPRFSNPGETYTLTAGGLIISAKDFATLMTILINDGNLDGRQFLHVNTVREMLTPQFEASKYEQCLGIRRLENMLDGRTMYYHPGSAYGVYSMAAFDTSDKSGVVVITTDASGTMDSRNIYKVCLDITQQCYNDVIDIQPAQAE